MIRTAARATRFRVLATLASHGVDHVVIGGWAVIAHGSTRTTNDIDFVASPEPENLKRLESALKDLKAELWGGDGAEIRSVDEALSLVLGLQS